MEERGRTAVKRVERAWECGRWRGNVGDGVGMWEMAWECGRWRGNVEHGMGMWEMA